MNYVMCFILTAAVTVVTRQWLPPALHAQIRDQTLGICEITVTPHTHHSVLLPSITGYLIKRTLLPPPTTGDINITSVLLTLTLALCGDIHSNPGPEPVCMCGFCELRVGWSHHAVCCDGCDVWYHKSCLDMKSAEYEHLNATDASWSCWKCDSMNHTRNLFHSFELDIRNSYSTLSNIVDHSITSVHSSVSDLTLQPIAARNQLVTEVTALDPLGPIALDLLDPPPMRVGTTLPYPLSKTTGVPFWSTVVVWSTRALNSAPLWTISSRMQSWAARVG